MELEEFLNDLYGGVFAQKAKRALMDCAAAVCDHDRKGSVTLTFSLEETHNHLVTVEHKINYKMPTPNGDTSETDTTKTPMYVGKGGKMTFAPDKQQSLFATEDQANSPAKEDR